MNFTTNYPGRLMFELCGANEAQRSLRPNERLVMCCAHDGNVY